VLPEVDIKQISEPSTMNSRKELSNYSLLKLSEGNNDINTEEAPRS